MAAHCSRCVCASDGLNAENFLFYFIIQVGFFGGGSSRGIMVRVRLVNQKFAGSSRRYGRDCRWWSECPALFPTEVRPSTKPPIAPRALQHWLPTAPGVFTVCVCFFVFTSHSCVCVHSDGLNAEHEFQVWDTILGGTLRPFLSIFPF